MPLLVITGSMGAGKTTLMAEASDLLTLAGVAHAAIDLDALGTVHVGRRAGADGVGLANLAAVWANYAAAGASRCLIACAVETRQRLDAICAAIPGSVLTVCRARAPLDTMRARVRLREPGLLQQALVERVAVLEDALDVAALEDFSVENDGRPITDAAREMLARAGWLSGEHEPSSALPFRSDQTP